MLPTHALRRDRFRPAQYSLEHYVKFAYNQVPRERWRSLLRQLLRECSYLPDPVARECVHSRIVAKFRLHTFPSQRSKLEHLFNRPLELESLARKQITFLRRAREGYPKQLFKVMREAYGRQGRRRLDWVRDYVIPPAESPVEAVAKEKPFNYGDDWRPPAIVTELLRSQHNNRLTAILHARHKKKVPESPKIPKNALGQPVAPRRRQNIRKHWYSDVLSTLLPPIPDRELSILEGFLTKSISWKAPKKRKPVGDWSVPEEYHDLTEFVTEGPSKGQTFRLYANGRPHKITPRTMRRIWTYIACMVPRIETDFDSGKHRISWDLQKYRDTRHVYTDSLQ